MRLLVRRTPLTFGAVVANMFTVPVGIMFGADVS
jgi:hypothetical protein